MALEYSSGLLDGHYQCLMTRLVLDELNIPSITVCAEYCTGEGLTRTELYFVPVESSPWREQWRSNLFHGGAEKLHKSILKTKEREQRSRIHHRYVPILRGGIGLLDSAWFLFDQTSDVWFQARP
ncbi:hypothetical protein Y1Q_0023797 [Alligator mississippiensis]|uniref:Uncharacterized protein n=1 Tax=Alligator mississippiensis TaxID=8496 RepID=A0A151MK88_ALLMI|nr:hypothetical protein Y1Q_0023797 [Alligator mississippiensis]